MVTPPFTRRLPAVLFAADPIFLRAAIAYNVISVLLSGKFRTASAHTAIYRGRGRSVKRTAYAIRYLRYLQYLQDFLRIPESRINTGLAGIFSGLLRIKRLPPMYQKIAPYVSKDCPLLSCYILISTPVFFLPVVSSVYPFMNPSRFQLSSTRPIYSRISC